MKAGPSQGRVLITGASGMLGSELMLTAPAGLSPVGTDLKPAPATAAALADAWETPEGQEGVQAFFDKQKPSWIS